MSVGGRSGADIYVVGADKLWPVVVFRRGGAAVLAGVVAPTEALGGNGKQEAGT